MASSDTGTIELSAWLVLEGEQFGGSLDSPLKFPALVASRTWPASISLAPAPTDP